MSHSKQRFDRDDSYERLCECFACHYTWLEDLAQRFPGEQFPCPKCGAPHPTVKIYPETPDFES